MPPKKRTPAASRKAKATAAAAATRKAPAAPAKERKKIPQPRVSKGVARRSATSVAATVKGVPARSKRPSTVRAATRVPPTAATRGRSRIVERKEKRQIRGAPPLRTAKKCALGAAAVGKKATTTTTTERAAKVEEDTRIEGDQACRSPARTVVTLATLLPTMGGTDDEEADSVVLLSSEAETVEESHERQTSNSAVADVPPQRRVSPTPPRPARAAAQALPLHPARSPRSDASKTDSSRGSEAGDHEGKDPRRCHSVEDSPEALTVDSEGARSALRWQQRMRASATPATSKRPGEAEEHRQPSGGSPRYSAEEEGMPVMEAVKQLFSRPARPICLSSGSESEPADHTCIMEDTAQPPCPCDGPRPRHSSHRSGSSSDSLPHPLHEARSCSPPAEAATPPPTSSSHHDQASRVRGADGAENTPDEPRCPSASVRDPRLAMGRLSEPSTDQQGEKAGGSNGGRAAPPGWSLPRLGLPAVPLKYTTSAGHLWMGGARSRSPQRSPSAPSQAWRRRAPSDELGVDYSCLPPAAREAPPFPSAPLFDQQQPQEAYSHLHASHTFPSPLPSLAEAQQRRSDAFPGQRYGDRSGRGVESVATAAEIQNESPPRVRLREPPVWRSPQTQGLPKSLSISPASLPGDGAGRARGGELPASLPPPRGGAPLPNAAALFPNKAPMDLEASSTGTLVAVGNAGLSRSPQMSPMAKELEGPRGQSSRLPAAGASGTASRSSTQLITKAAATRPTASPGTMWIYINDDDDEEDEEAKRVAPDATRGDHNGAGQNNAPSSSPIGDGDAIGHRAIPSVSHIGEDGAEAHTQGGRAGDDTGTASRRDTAAVGRKSTPASPSARCHPIAAILSPTFRPRRRPPDAPAGGGPMVLRQSAMGSAPEAATGQLTAPLIRLDDDTEEEEEEEAPLRKRARTSPLPSAPTRLGVASPTVAASPSSLLILDDDDDDDDDEDKETEQVDAAKREATAIATSPPKPHVRDFIFPHRLDPELRPFSTLHASIQAYQHLYNLAHHGREEDEANRSLCVDPASPRCTLGNALSDSPQILGAPQLGRKRGRSTSNRAAAAASSLQDWGRPADALLREFFPSKFTRKNFYEAARQVLPPSHFLSAGEFWAAFASAEFMGEGSFGLVWRCCTVDGDLVAVKSCPLLLRTRANIEDSFSTIREIATMRFLSELQVPYILPLHSAFLVHGREALPPMAQAALEWRQRLREEAEAALLEEDVRQLSRGAHHLLQRRLAARRRERAPVGGAVHASTTWEERVTAEIERRATLEGPAARATRARLESVRLPRFLSITQNDLQHSDATAFLVTELCDGDIEGIARSDGVAKGVAYCVSAALAAMHQLGLLHLDLKPSNVLFAYEHGPSQQRQAVLPSSSDGADATAAAAALGSSMDPVKFYLSDFGNCRLVGPGALDGVPDACGTYEYMDVRALRDAVCGRPTDAFGLGATLYELLFGKRLYPKCQNPLCVTEEDHSRACFVEAACLPVAWPSDEPPTRTTAGVSGGRATTAAAAADTGTSVLLRRSRSGTASAALSSITKALLRSDWATRMTAEECRHLLVEVFHITQAEALGSPTRREAL